MGWKIADYRMHMILPLFNAKQVDRAAVDRPAHQILKAQDVRYCRCEMRANDCMRNPHPSGWGWHSIISASQASSCRPLLL